MWGILKTNAVALERGEGKKAGMEGGRTGRPFLYNLDAKQNAVRRNGNGV
jgi:hypothetical protein